MSYFKLGPLLRQRRVTLGYTQEVLADGICAVNTLSRYENGERMPTKEHLELLLQRLGLSDAIFDAYLDEKTFRLHELKYQIRQAIMESREADAAPLLKEYEHMSDPKSKVSQQFILLYRTKLNDQASPEEKIANLEKAITLTCPNYAPDNLPSILSFEEGLILNHIAEQLSIAGRIDASIRILYHLNNFYDSSKVNKEETVRAQPALLYNLSKLLGIASRFDECIEICDKGIRLARTTGRCFVLAGTLYNKACALAGRNRPGDRIAAQNAAQMAKDFAMCMGQNDLVPYVDSLLAKI